MRVLLDLTSALLERPPAELNAYEDILAQGLDSVRLMMLVEQLRDRGADIDFLDLAEFTTLADWAELLVERGFPAGPCT